MYRVYIVSMYICICVCNLKDSIGISIYHYNKLITIHSTSRSSPLGVGSIPIFVWFALWNMRICSFLVELKWNNTSSKYLKSMVNLIKNNGLPICSMSFLPAYDAKGSQNAATTTRLLELIGDHVRIDVLVHHLGTTVGW